ncbi:CHASE domain-containing protein [Microvirga sp. G4-2]|uniref:CHASE domain-containing protein n=1 Tax=Microvirga sp. G4-2 TaxID=3434467 RepID=UPI004044E0AD
MLQQPRRRRMLIPVATLLGGVTASVLVALSLWNIIDARDRVSFERRVDQAQDGIRDRLNTYVTLLRAGVGLFNANGLDVDRAGFRAFTAGLRLKNDYPGIQGIGFSTRVGADERDAFVMAQRQQGVPDFRIWPHHPRSEFHTIVYLEPLDRRNEAAIGYDMFSEPTRRAAMERARDTGQPTASGRIELVQEIDAAKQAGFLIYAPVYRGTAPPKTTPERQQMLAGFVYSPFRADDLFTAIFQGGRNPGLELRVYDGPPAPENLLHRSGLVLADGQGERTARYSETRTLDVAGRPWTIAYFSSPQSELSSTRSLIPVFFAIGLIASLLVSGVLWAEVRARAAADQKSREAQARAQELAVLNRTGAATAAELDLEQVVQTVTDAGVKLTGAQFGAFFYNTVNDRGETYMLYALSGVEREAFSQFPMPRPTAIFHPTFSGEGIIRSADILQDPRYGRNEPHKGMPKGHLPVRSYLAVPVTSRSSEVLGGLLFGHAEPGMFTPEHENLLVGIASQAAIAIDNARLLQDAQRELEERRRAEEGLRESEGRLRLALEAGQLGSWELDVAANRRLLSPRSAEIFGVPADELLESEAWQATIHPDDRERVSAAFEAALQGGAPYRAEFRVLAKDGRERWVSSQAVVHRDRSGTPQRVVGIHQDITERKRWEEHQLLLINELNHRVKNTLATVQSIAGQTLRNASSMEQVREDLEGRLFALSRVHNVLTRENWEGANLREVVEQAIKPYRQHDDDHFDVVGDDARLSPRMALAIALALQELATNAVKYGALSNATGLVRISWRITGSAADRRLVLHWEEAGGPVVNPPVHRGFGSRLIERSFAMELGGRATMEFRPEGVRCTVDAPLS